MRKAVGAPEQRLLADLLAEARASAEMSQRDLAALLDKPQAFVSRYESGQRRLDLIELDQICDVLGLDLVELVTAWDRYRRLGRPKRRPGRGGAT